MEIFSRFRVTSDNSPGMTGIVAIRCCIPDVYNLKFFLLLSSKLIPWIPRSLRRVIPHVLAAGGGGGRGVSFGRELLEMGPEFLENLLELLSLISWWLVEVQGVARRGELQPGVALKRLLE